MPRTDTSLHRGHRERFLATLSAQKAAAVVPTGTTKIRNADTEYRFRPESDFWYLTGFAEPDSVLVLAPRNEGPKSVLFLRDRMPEEETWTGRRLGVERAPEALGVDAAYPIGELWQRLAGLFAGHERLVYATGRDAEFDRRIIEVLTGLRGRARRGAVAPTEWVEPTDTLHEQRLFKTEAELEAMRHAADVTAEAHLAAMREARPGRNEGEIEALVEYAFRRRGSTGPAYTSIVAGGENACILHYVENDRPLADGELLLIDAGAEWDYYASDVTRTFPIGGRFGEDQRRLYDVVLAAQKAAVKTVRPGATLADVHLAALGVLCEGLVELGLVEGPAEKVVEEERYKRFYMHKTSHWLGLDVHDAGRYFTDGASRPLAPGMMLTVEPGLYVAPDDDEADPRWRGIGVRIEDDVLVTEDGFENLTAAIPKEPEEVEAACASPRA